MEAVPRLPMLHFDLKVTTEATSFVNLKRYIAECYQEDPETYSSEVYALESLRSAATRPSVNVKGCNILKRYYCQLHSLQSRFPLTSDRHLFQFSWRDIYSSGVTQATDIRYDMAVILYNYGVLHTQLGAADARSTDEGIKLVCTHYQCAAWAFGHLKEAFPQATSGDLSPEILQFMEQLSYAQAQECILEKSLIDNRKAGIVAKVTSQIIAYYNQAYAALLNTSDDASFAELIGVGSKHFKEYKQYMQFKISYLSCILLLYRGQQAEEQQKMGERVSFYQAAFDKLEEAQKQCKGMQHLDQIAEALSFVMDVVEGKRKSAKNENEFIYHEEVPEIASFTAVQGANLVKGIPFSVTDPEVAGEDIFHRLVPMKAHEASSLYSEEKATVIRKLGARIEEKDNELNKFMNSLNVGSLNFDTQNQRLPQGLVDRCAELNAKTDAIPDLVAGMSALADTCTDVESMLLEIKELLNEEERHEKSYQQTMGARPSGHFAELNREFVKYQEAHNKAGESNDTLRKAMGLHVNNLKMLAQPLNDIQASVPTSKEQIDTVLQGELNGLLAKVNEMSTQRAQLFASLRDAITNDDITAQVIAWGDKKLDKLFKRELNKHEKTVLLIDQNLSAQGNILRALTDCYARCAPFIKAIIDTKQKREHFFSSLASSYDVYDDLLGKSSKGLEFYRKLQANIQKLFARVRGAHDVQDEERQQRLRSSAKYTSPTPQVAAVAPTVVKIEGPKLRDYLKNGSISSGVAAPPPTAMDSYGGQYVPLIRPSPLGSETTVTSTCVTTTNNDKYNPAMSYQQPNEPPPPYAAYGSATSSGGYAAPPTYNYATSGDAPMQYSAIDPNPMVYHHHISSQPPPPYNFYNTMPTAEETAAVTATSYSNQSNYGGQQQHPTYPQPTLTPPQQSFQTSYTPNAYAASIATPQNSVYDQSSFTLPTYTNVASSNETLSSGTQYGQQMYSNYAIQEPASPQPAYSNQAHVQPAPSPTPSQSSITGNHNNWQSSGGGSTLSQQMAQLSIYGHGQQQQQQLTSQQPQQHQQQPQSQQQVPIPTTNYSNSGGYAETTRYSYDNSAGAYQSIPPVIAATEPTSVTPANLPDQNNSSTYTTTSQPNYQITANVQYVTGYDQTGTIQPSYGSHPGYEFNQQSGTYQYRSGYQIDSNYPAIHNAYAQYTSAGSGQLSSTTESTNYGIGGQTYAHQYADQTASYEQTQQQQMPTYDSQQQYYPQQVDQYATPSYQQVQPDTQQQYQQMPVQPAIQQQYQEQPTGIAAALPEQQQIATPVKQELPPQVQPVPAQLPPSSNIDLLSGLDFAGGADLTITAPPLQPTSLVPAPITLIPKRIVAETNNIPAVIPPAPVAAPILPASFSLVDDKISDPFKILDRKASTDNLSVCSDVSSIDPNFDWESASQRNDEIVAQRSSVTSSGGLGEYEAILSNFRDPFDDPKTLKWFHKEVERFEKNMETLNVKTLNGTTHLASKWNELQDLLVKDESKRTTVVAKLFPDKNRTNDSIPYDHARVMLPTTTDDYINACHIRELGPSCPHFILAQTPIANTVKDFWCMIWSQKARVVVCLHSATEMLDPFFPTELNKEHQYDDYSVTVSKQFDLSHCIERSVRVTMHGSDALLDITIVQIKAWPKNSAPNIVGITQNIIVTLRQQMKTHSQHIGPVILNCVSGSERSGLVALAIAAVLGSNSKRPSLINAVDVWYRISSQRKGALRDIATLELSMQIVLCNAHELLNKRGIMTSYQMKNAQTARAIVKEEVNDPFSDLDPLWKLKQNK